MSTPLTLEEWSWIALIISSAVNVVLVGISTAVAVYVYKWHREVAKIETSRCLQEDLRHFNELILSNEDLQALAIETHPWGSITKDEIVKMYCYFICLNIAVSMFDAKVRRAVDPKTYESQINNTANITFNDREFIKQHVLPRGYSLAFREELYRRWERIDRRGVLVSA